MANVSPEATDTLFSLNVTGTAPFTASMAEAASVTDAPAAEVASVRAGALAATTGAVVSFTSKLKLVLAVLPARSVADARTVWLPTEKNVIPGVTGVPFSVKVTGSVPSIASLVSATKLTGEPAAEVASVADGALAVSTGAVVSSVKEIEAEAVVAGGIRLAGGDGVRSVGKRGCEAPGTGGIRGRGAEHEPCFRQRHHRAGVACPADLGGVRDGVGRGGARVGCQRDRHRRGDGVHDDTGIASGRCCYARGVERAGAIELLSSTATLPYWSAATRSSLPSPFTSAVVTDRDPPAA